MVRGKFVRGTGENRLEQGHLLALRLLREGLLTAPFLPNPPFSECLGGGIATDAKSGRANQSARGNDGQLSFSTIPFPASRPIRFLAALNWVFVYQTPYEIRASKGAVSR